MGTLSVRENLHFSASLRLSSSTSGLDRKNRVEDLLRDLDLQEVADSKESDPTIGTGMQYAWYVVIYRLEAHRMPRLNVAFPVEKENVHK